VPSKRSLAIPQILAQRSNARFSTGPQGRDRRKSVNLNHPQLKFGSRAVRVLELRHRDQCDFQRVCRTGREKLRNEKRTNEAVILLKTKESRFSGSSQAVRSLKTGNLCGVSRYIAENTTLSIRPKRRLGIPDVGMALVVAAQATERPENGRPTHRGSRYVKLRHCGAEGEKRETKIVRTNPRCC
jgi:hypothetical protein